MRASKLLSLLISIIAIQIHANAQKTNANYTSGKVVTEVFTSDILKDNRIGIDANRNIKVYLPPDYETSGRSYPVVYFLHNIFANNDAMLQDGKIPALIERAFTKGVIDEFIFVIPDYRTATTGSIYDNSPVSGRWIDYTINEIVPFVDKKFRTIRKKESRAIIGEFMGGRGALRIAMARPDIFSVVYAINPVATGMGNLPWAYSQIIEQIRQSDLPRQHFIIEIKAA